MARENKQVKDERSPELKNDLEARLDELGTDPAQVGTNMLVSREVRRACRLKLR